MSSYLRWALHLESISYCVLHTPPPPPTKKKGELIGKLPLDSIVVEG